MLDPVERPGCMASIEHRLGHIRNALVFTQANLAFTLHFCDIEVDEPSAACAFEFLRPLHSPPFNRGLAVKTEPGFGYIRCWWTEVVKAKCVAGIGGQKPPH